MEAHSGTDLLETFNDLGINTGNVSKLTIDAWFDTDCEATKEMLNWMCTHLSKDNVLTAQENDEYEQALDNSLLTGKQYEVALAQLHNDFPGLLDYEKNCFEVECLEDELEMLLEKEGDLEYLLGLNGELNKKLTKEINKASEEEIASGVQREKAQQKCIDLSCKLDNAHEKLQQQISRYAEHLNEFEQSTRPTFISNIPTTNYDQYYLDIVSYLGVLTKREYEFLPKLEVTVRTAKKRLLQDSNSNVDFATDQLEVLRLRIAKSVQNYLRSQVTEEILRAEIQFLKSLNVNDIIISAPNFDDSLNFVLEASILSKQELLEGMCFSIESVARQISNGFVDRPKITLIENTMAVNQKKLENLTELNTKVTEILAKHILLYLLLEKEKNDVQSTDKFFRDVHYYITHSLQNCEVRTEFMIDVINKYGVYRNLPMEQKFKLLTVIKALLTDNSNETSNNSLAIDAMKNFYNECNLIEQQVFFNDYAEHRRFSQQIEQEIETMQKFLISGPTKQIIVIPHQLIDSFNQVNELLEVQASALKSVMQTFNDAEKKLAESKWFQMRRQLWMWFLLEPKKVLQAIDQIETAVKQNRNENA